MRDNTQPEAGSTHIIRYALEMGLLWIDGDGRDKVREALDALDTLEAQPEAIGAGGVSGPLLGRAMDHFRDATKMMGRWYMVTHDGVATLCEDREDAEKEAKDADMAWPHSGPHRAVQLVEASMAQEAQEPVAWQHRTRPTWGGWSPWESCTKEQAEDCWKTPLLNDWAYEARALYTAPQPAPAPLSDEVVKDAARWRMAVLIGSEVMLHPNKRTHATAVKAYMDATHSGSDLTGAVDAAIAAQGGKDAG